jgi:hypothetical protein
MKTKIVSFAATVFAAVTFSQIALAGPPMPIHRATSGPANRPAGFVMKSEACKAMPCCKTKLDNNSALGGRGANSSFKKVRACEKSCTVPAKDHGAVCGKGRRA